MGDQYPRPRQDHGLVRESPAPAAYPPPRLDGEVAELVAARKNLHIQFLPEFIPFLKALYEEGLIDGWRAVTSITTRDPK